MSATGLTLLAVAGCAKLVALGDFAQSLDSFTLLPAWLRSVAVPILPAAEVLPIMGWALFPRRRRAAEYAGFALTASILLVVAWHVLHDIRPTCNCYCKLLEWLAAERDFKAQIWPAATLLCMVFGGSVLRTAPPVTHYRQTAIRRSTPAFTLVEILVVILIIGILTALAAPALLSARQSGRISVTLSRLRSASGLLNVYATDERDAVLYFVNPATDQQVIRSDARNITVRVPQYFAAMSLWTLAVADRFFDGSPPEAEMTDARAPRSDAQAFVFPCVFAAHPDYWNRATRLNNRSQWGSVKLGDARTPAKKAAFISPFPYGYWLDGRKRESPATGAFSIPMAFLDGHAAETSSTTIQRGMLTGDGTFSWCNWHPVDGIAGTHSIDGIRGADTP